MPKIRTKEIYKLENNQYKKKSGVLSRSIHSSIKKNNQLKTYFSESFLHSTNGSELKSTPYNDNKTYLFVESNINNTFPLPDSFKTNNLVLHTPNEFDTTDTITKTIDSTILNRFYKPEYYEDEYIPFADERFLKSSDISKEEHVININLDFDDDCRLSFNKNTASNKAQSVTFDNEIFPCYNAPTVYYNFNNKRWDYLGDVTKNYFNSIADFKTAPIGFKPINNTNTVVVKNQAAGHPINTFGFPFDSKFQGFERHTLSMKNYITQPFVLEKIKIRFKSSLKSETPSLGSSPINKELEVLNSLNFFMLNQRRNLNEASFQNLSLDVDEINYYDSNTGNQTESVTYSVTNPPIYTTIKNIGLSNETVTVSTGYDTDNSSFDRRSCQRELVAYFSLVNYGSGSKVTSASSLDLVNIRNNSDTFYADNTVQTGNKFAEVMYTNKTFEDTFSVKTPTYSNKLDSFSNFNVYSKSTFSNRSGTEYRTERSTLSDFTPFTNIEVTTDDSGVNSLSLGDNYSKENSYMLTPEDHLIFGFSFNPSMTLDSSNAGKDIMTLHDKVEISLIGKYYQGNTSIVLQDKNLKTNFVKKINNIETKYFSNDVGFNNIYLNKGAYYDTKIGPYTIIINGQNYNINFPNIDSSALSASVPGASVFATSKTFTGFLKVINSNEVNIDNDQTNSTFHLNYRKYGQVSNRLNSNTYEAFTDMTSMKRYNTVLKRFRNNIFKEITSTLSNNSDVYSRLTYEGETQGYFRE